MENVSTNFSILINIFCCFFLLFFVAVLESDAFDGLDDVIKFMLERQMGCTIYVNIGRNGSEMWGSMTRVYIGTLNKIYGLLRFF